MGCKSFEGDGIYLRVTVRARERVVFVRSGMIKYSVTPRAKRAINLKGDRWSQALSFEPCITHLRSQHNHQFPKLRFLLNYTKLLIQMQICIWQQSFRLKDSQVLIGELWVEKWYHCCQDGRRGLGNCQFNINTL